MFILVLLHHHLTSGKPLLYLCSRRPDGEIVANPTVHIGNADTPMWTEPELKTCAPEGEANQTDCCHDDRDSEIDGLAHAHLTTARRVAVPYVAAISGIEIGSYVEDASFTQARSRARRADWALTDQFRHRLPVLGDDDFLTWDQFANQLF